MRSNLFKFSRHFVRQDVHSESIRHPIGHLPSDPRFFSHFLNIGYSQFLGCRYKSKIFVTFLFSALLIDCAARGYDPSKPPSLTNVKPLKYDESKRPAGPHIGYEPQDAGVR